MNLSPLRSFLLLSISVTFLFSACSDDSSVQEPDLPFEVIARIPAVPDKLNPFTTFQAYSRVVNEQLFQYLLQFDPVSLELQPQLAVARAEMKEITEGPYAGGVAYTFEIRPEAKWSDGKSVTATDVAFSLKTLFHPQITPSAIRAYFDSFKDFKIDPDNPRKFTVFSNQKYMLGEAAIGTIAVLPEHLYDESGVMKNFTLPQLSDEDKANELIAANPDLTAFAESFGSTERSHDPALISGSGPYRVEEWASGQYIRLVKKENWWGDEVENTNLTLSSNPTEITYKVIPDQTTTVNALRSGEIDVSGQVDSRQFSLLKQDSSFTQEFNLYTPLAFQMYYLGFNNRIPKLNDPKVRRALAHALDLDNVIENLFAGLAERVVSPFHPSQPYYHRELPLIDFNLEKSKSLLAEAGWVDSNSDGTVDKVLNGQRVELQLKFLTSTNSQFGRDLALFYKEALQQVGVELIIDAKEFNALRDDFRRLDFEVFAGAWAKEPLPDDPKQLWFSGYGAPGGSNRMGFGNTESDRLIEEIRTTLDDEARNQLYKEFQEMLYEAQPGIFMFAPQERIVISKKFEGEPSSLRPGFFLNGFQPQAME